MIQYYYIALLLYILSEIFIYYKYEFKKYSKNIPYNPSKKKKSISSRVYLGILGGFHYAHFIGTYNHQKYNTQVFTPETLECNVA